MIFDEFLEMDLESGGFTTSLHKIKQPVWLWIKVFKVSYILRHI
jgi:hypothetical protein